MEYKYDLYWQTYICYAMSEGYCQSRHMIEDSMHAIASNVGGKKTYCRSTQVVLGKKRD